VTLEPPHFDEAATQDSQRGPFWKDDEWKRRTRGTFAGMWLATAVGFVGTVIAARGLGPDEYGAVVYAIAITTLVASVLDFSFQEAVVHHGARAIADGDPRRLSGLIRSAVIFDALIGVVLSLIIFVAAEPLASIAGGEGIDPSLVRIAVLTVLGATIDGTTGAVLLLARRADLRAWLMALSNVFRLVFVVTAVAWGDAEAVVLAFGAAVVITGVSQAVVAWRVAWKKWTRPEPDESPRRWLRILFPFAFQSSLTGTIDASGDKLAKVVLIRSAGPISLGILDVAWLPISVAGLVQGPLGQALFPEQARLAAENDRPGLRKATRGYALIALAVAIPGAIVGYLILPWLIEALYTDAYAAAITPARVMLIAAVAYLVRGWIRSLPAAIGRPIVRTRLSLLEMALLVGSMIVLSDHGATGGAAAFAITYAVMAVVWFLMSERLLRDPMPGSPRDETPSTLIGSEVPR
jgi:O-antigen/teichoic acid export membrane protein